jgi:hypothetical protein
MLFHRRFGMQKKEDIIPADVKYRSKGEIICTNASSGIGEVNKFLQLLMHKENLLVES